MKKSRFLVLALVVAVMLVGAGYAAWTDKLTVTSTVATGELNVEFVGPENPGGGNFYASPRMFYLHKDAPGATQWNWASATPNDLLTGKVTYGAKEMTFEFGNMYPGTRGAGLYTMENNGSIPAVIDSVVVTSRTINAGPDEVAQVLPAMRVTHSWLKIYRDGAEVASKYLADIALADLQTELNNFFRGKRLQPNDKIVLGSTDIANVVVGETIGDTFNFEIPYNSLNGNDGEKETVEIKVEFNFIQHNMYDPTPGV